MTTPHALRRGIPAIALLSTVALVAGCTAGGGAPAGDADGETLESMDPIVLRVSDPNPESASNAIALTEWMDYVTEETDGKVTFETYFSGTLHSGVEGLSALEQGLTDITFYYPGYFADELPVANWVTRTFAVEGTAGYPHSGLANGPATAVLYEESEDIRAELAEYNAVPLAIWGGGTYDLLCTKPVDSLETAKGILVNSAGAPWIGEVESLGMTNEFIEIPEEYEAMQRGILDCTTNTVSPMMSRGTWEVAKYYIPVDFSPSLAVGYMFNQEVWDSLPLEVRQIMHDGKSIIMGGFNEVANERYAEFAEKAPEMGVKFLDPTALNEALRPFQEKMAGEVVSSAPAGATHAQEDFDLFSSEMDKWVSILVDDLGIKQVEKTPDDLVDLYLSVRDVPWDDYKAAIQESLEPYRPE